jgi:hypothetical protein
MARNSNSKRSNNKSRVSNVRIVDPSSGTDGLRVDRQLSAMKTSESQTRVVVADTRNFGTSQAETNGTYGFDEIFASDEFASLVAQYNLFRISSIKFDIYDVNPGTSVFNIWGIWHDNYETTPPAFSLANVADLPDSRVISAGTGQTTLYWVAHGTAEQQFQSTTTAGSVAQRFGGLKFYNSANATANIGKYTIVVHAVVDFRGRR